MLDVKNEGLPERVFFVELKHKKTLEKSLKCALATPNSSDLSFGTSCHHSQSRDTIPLSEIHADRTLDL